MMGFWTRRTDDKEKVVHLSDEARVYAAQERAWEEVGALHKNFRWRVSPRALQVFRGFSRYAEAVSYPSIHLEPLHLVTIPPDCEGYLCCEGMVRVCIDRSLPPLLAELVSNDGQWRFTLELDGYPQDTSRRRTVR